MRLRMKMLVYRVLLSYDIVLNNIPRDGHWEGT